MRYGLRELAAMARTPAGRLQIGSGVLYRAWPVLSRVARLHRRTLARNVKVVAVVGSLGKSTTARAVAAALDAPVRDTMLRNAWSSLALAVLRLRPGQAYGVVETGIAGPGEMQRYARVVQPDIAVVTAIASEHHRSLRTFAVTRDEKAWMVRALRPDGVAILNGDDPNVTWMRSVTMSRVVTFGFGEACDVRATDVRLAWPRGMTFVAHVSGAPHAVALKLLGRHQVRAALAAMAVAHVAGVPLGAAVQRLEALDATPGRMQPVALPNGIVLVRDDYKAALETIHAALDTLAEIPCRRRVMVLGEISEPPGNQHQTYRAIGRRVAEVASLVVIAGGDNAVERYRAGLRSGGLDPGALVRGGRTPQEIAAALQPLLREGDVVLLKGRDTQKLDRVRLILQGRAVRCDIRHCRVRIVGCEECPMLEQGWSGHARVT